VACGTVSGGGSGRHPITVGGWRTGHLGPMQVVAGSPGREHVHFEPPEAARIAMEMDRFLTWFEDKTTAIDPVLKAAVAHIWFVTIHPFDAVEQKQRQADTRP
jgi:Fic family protein